MRSCAISRREWAEILRDPEIGRVFEQPDSGVLKNLELVGVRIDATPPDKPTSSIYLLNRTDEPEHAPWVFTRIDGRYYLVRRFEPRFWKSWARDAARGRDFGSFPRLYPPSFSDSSVAACDRTWG